MTKLDIYLSAVKHASETLDITDHLKMQEETLSRFKASGIDPANSSYWYDQFTQARSLQSALRSQPALETPKPETAGQPLKT